jgi:hypothetical protein
MITDPIFMVRGCEINGRVTVQYGDHCMGQKKVHEWMENISVGRMNIVHDVRAERPSSGTCVEAAEQINQRIRDNRKICIDEISSEMSIILGIKWCKNGLRPIRKYCILMESRNLLTVGPYTLKSGTNA